jgi:hypothetical protein
LIASEAKCCVAALAEGECSYFFPMGHFNAICYFLNIAVIFLEWLERADSPFVKGITVIYPHPKVMMGRKKLYS